MDNPFKHISDAFKEEFEVRFVIERMDGSLTLTLSNDQGVVVRRALSSDQLGDTDKLESTIQSIRFGLAIDHGQGLRGLDAIVDGNRSCLR
jgi:hypothetical protein